MIMASKSYAVLLGTIAVSYAFVPSSFSKPSFGISTKLQAVEPYTGEKVTEYVGKTAIKDRRYPSFTVGFNGRWKADQCGAIYVVNSVKDTVDALNDALEYYDGGIKVRSGGHCYENFVMNEGTTAIIDVRNLQEWGKDDDRGYFLSTGDTNWGAFNKIFNNYGFVLPGGSCYSVGLGGHISGGGDGIMSRKYGLTVDYLTGVEIVVAPDGKGSARSLYVSPESDTEDERNLFWACAGGGCGNYGIITKYYFKTLPDAPMGAIITNVAWKWEDIDSDGPEKGAERLQGILDWYTDFAKDTGVKLEGMENNWDSSGKFPIMHVANGESQMQLHTAYFDDASKEAAEQYHELLKQDLQEKAIPFTAPTTSLPYHGGYWSRAPTPSKGIRKKVKSLKERLGGEPWEPEEVTTDFFFFSSTQTMNPSGPNQRGKYKSSYMLDYFPEDKVKSIYKWLHEYPADLKESDGSLKDGAEDEMKQSLIQVDCFGGKISTHSDVETSIAQRKYVTKCQYQTYWVDPDLDSLHLKWIQDFYDETYGPYGGAPDPNGLGEGVFEGCYYNYPDVDLNSVEPPAEAAAMGYKKGRDYALYLYFLDNYKGPNREGRDDGKTLFQVKQVWDKNDIFNHQQSVPAEDE